MHLYRYITAYQSELYLYIRDIYLLVDSLHADKIQPEKD